MFTQPSPVRRADALRIYYVLEGVSSLLFHLIFPIYVVYFATNVGLDPFQIVLVGSVFEASIFLFEIPTGIVADVYSRRLSIIIGFTLVGIGFLIEGLLPAFGWVFLAEIIMGVGITFTSGAVQAWITDEIGMEQANRAFVRAAQIRTLAGMLGIVCGVMLASSRLDLPFLAAGVLALGLALLLVMLMPETGFQRTPQAERNTWATLTHTFRDGIRHVRLHPVLIPILVIGFLFAFHTEGFDQLWQNHILEGFSLPGFGTLDPLVWFGVMTLGANLLVLVLNEGVQRWVRLAYHAAHALRLIYAVMAAGILVFALAQDFALAVAAYWLVMSVRGVSQPITEAWINQHAEPGIRATLFSINGQIGAVGEVIGGPPVGWIGKIVSLRAAIAVCGMVLMFTLPLFAPALRRAPDASLAEEHAV